MWVRIGRDAQAYCSLVDKLQDIPPTAFPLYTTLRSYSWYLYLFSLTNHQCASVMSPPPSSAIPTSKTQSGPIAPPIQTITRGLSFFWQLPSQWPPIAALHSLHTLAESWSTRRWSKVRKWREKKGKDVLDWKQEQTLAVKLKIISSWSLWKSCFGHFISRSTGVPDQAKSTRTTL